MSKQANPILVAGTQTSYTVRGEREITMSRVYDAPRDAVFRAFCDPKRIPEWWGAPETPTKVDAMDVRRGGKWRFTQRDAKGNVHIFHGEYREVDAPRKIVSTLEYGESGGPAIVETYEFLEQGRKTLLRVTSVFPSGAALGGMLSVGMEQTGGWIEGSRHQWRLERLARLVED